MDRGLRTLRTVVWGSAAVTLIAACDTSVTNPGPTPDEALNEPTAFTAVVRGAQRALSDAIGGDSDTGGQLLYWGAALTFEINPAGSTGSFGIPPRVQLGVMDDLDSEGDWEASNQARFVAEEALRRFNEIGLVAANNPDGVPQALLAEAYLLAGYANRLLGENYCEAVLPAGDDPGTPSPHTDYLARAEQHFSDAISNANAAGDADIETAGFAGRASVRAYLATYGQASWADAASDASQVADDFVRQAEYSDQDQDQFNYLVWANGNAPYRAHTQWGTFSEIQLLSLDPADDRISWRFPDPDEEQTGDAGVDKFGGRVPWYPQTKYPEVDSPVNLSSGWEMRLIEAEAVLAGGSPAGAVDMMNIRRGDLGLALYDITVSADSAWSLLKLERQIELWLEARRLGDLRRWIENEIPGSELDGIYQDMDGDDINETRTETMLDPIQRGSAVPNHSSVNPQGSVASTICFPIGRSERETNPNVDIM